MCVCTYNLRRPAPWFAGTDDGGVSFAPDDGMPALADEPPATEDSRTRERRLTSPDVRARRAAEIERMMVDIASRIRPVCMHLSEDDFQEFTRDMARVQIRFRELERRLDG
jgi:hypothetical protein